MFLNKLLSFFLLLVIIGFAVTEIITASIPEEIVINEIEEFTSLPDFSQYKDRDEKIQLFFDFVKPIAEFENNNILQDRNKLIGLIWKSNKGLLTFNDIDWINEKAEHYKLKEFSYQNIEDLEYLKTRMDIIPELLVLSQAAIESNWGTSGFSQKANNLFGMRTRSPNRGIIPKNRKNGSKIYVAKYITVNQSVRSYIHNLNTHKAYGNLREMRADFRRTNSSIDAYQLIQGLEKYSIEGKIYLQKVKRTMKKHEDKINGTI